MNRCPLLRPATSLLLVFLLLAAQAPLSSPAEASLTGYLSKYRNIPVSPGQLKRIARYNHLIEYFSSFAYIRPKHRVNADFIRALMLAESNGHPKALSSKGAKGLCQITFATGKRAARELAQKNLPFRYVSKRRLANLKPRDLYSPAVNILLTCYLIAKYNAAFQGKLDLVVSAWNAGENSISNNRPPQYKETLNLIGKVNGYFSYFLKN
ncbi:lytic transglycosylase domain-containing protein [Desulfogranum mediterraneum]|uniref:lytic transglycosylase domain-containing protein n=1 Tax=Desulfogranum mediterraneum TaxID=160661 RepID=UPI00048E7B8E|nr:lytic transglycosylase domain-containing protein [Desulfogranum mediterraneum]